MEDALLGTAHQLGLGSLECRSGFGLVAGGNRLLDLADEGPHAADAVLVDLGAAGGDAGGLLRRFRVGHLALVLLQKCV